MKSAFFVSVSAFTVLSVIAVWSLEMPLRTQQSRKGEVTTRVTEIEWSVITTGLPDNLRDLQFLDEMNGWGITANSIWQTKDGGQTWIEMRRAPSVQLLKNYERQETLEELQFVSKSEGWIVEGSSLLHTEDAGVSWEKSKPDGVTIRGVRFLERANGWFVGQLLCLPSRKGEIETWRPVIYGTTDGGKNWRRLYLGPEDRYPLWDLWPLSSQNIWAVGFSVLRSNDAGVTWKKVHIDWQGVSGMPSELRFLDSDVGWMRTNDGGGYLFTKNGGETWERRSISMVPGGYGDIAYVSATEVWGVANAIYRSTDSGRVWTKVSDGDYSRIAYLADSRCIFLTGKRLGKIKLPQ